MHYHRMVRDAVVAIFVLFVLSACASQSRVGVTSGGTVQTKSRSEPIFYNGQHYDVNYTYSDALKLFDIKVKGTSTVMTSKDQGTASAIATSALRYFACPDRLKGRLVGEPQFTPPTWSIQARCA
jgi:hypothetical protein